MQREKKDTLQLSNDKHCKIKLKESKPALDNDFLSVAFFKFVQNIDLSNGVTPAHGMQFTTYIGQLREQFKTTSVDIEITNKKPIAAMIMSL